MRGVDVSVSFNDPAVAQSIVGIFIYSFESFQIRIVDQFLLEKLLLLFLVFFPFYLGMLYSTFFEDSLCLMLPVFKV